MKARLRAQVNPESDPPTFRALPRAVYDETVNLRRMLRALLASLLVVAGAVTAPPASADGGQLEVEIASVSTPVLNLTDPQQVIEIKGALTNTSTTPIGNPVVHLWRLPEPIRSIERLTEVLAEPPLGVRVADPDLVYEVDPTLDKSRALLAGERADFTLTVPLSRLTTRDSPLTEDAAVYLFGVQVKGTPQGQGRSTVAESYFPVTATTHPVTSSALVVLAATPTWLPDGTFLDASLAAQLSGELEALLVSAERPGVQAAVDPYLYEAIDRLSRPHSVAGGQAPGNGVALRFIRRLDALHAEGRLWRLAYGNPDLARADATDQLEQVLAWSRSAEGSLLDNLDQVAVLDDGADEPLVAKLSEFDTVIVRNATGAMPGPPRIIGATAERPDLSLPEGARLAGRIAAEFLATRPPLYVIDSGATARDDAEMGVWRTHVPPTATPAVPIRWSTGTPADPWPKVVEALRSADRAASLLADLTSSRPQDLAGLGATAFSAGFDSQDAAVAYVRAASPARVDLDRISLNVVSSFVMGARTNTFPATLTNDLDVPVTLGVRFTSDSPQRIRVPDLAPVTVQPGGSLNLTITPEATANGVALVRAQVVTPNGAAVGKSTTIEITATDFGRVGWIIILISGAVLVGGTAWRIRAVRREKAKTSPKEDSERASQ